MSAFFTAESGESRCGRRRGPGCRRGSSDHGVTWELLTGPGAALAPGGFGPKTDRASSARGWCVWATGATGGGGLARAHARLVADYSCATAHQDPRRSCRGPILSWHALSLNERPIETNNPHLARGWGGSLGRWVSHGFLVDELKCEYFIFIGSLNLARLRVLAMYAPR